MLNCHHLLYLQIKTTASDRILLSVRRSFPSKPWRNLTYLLLVRSHVLVHLCLHVSSFVGERNWEKTKTNGEPKWRQIWKFSKIIFKIVCWPSSERVKNKVEMYSTANTHAIKSFYPPYKISTMYSRGQYCWHWMNLVHCCEMNHCTLQLKHLPHCFLLLPHQMQLD